MKTPQTAVTTINLPSHHRPRLRFSVAVLTASLIFLTCLSTALASLQKNWRYCEKCHAMFYDGYPNKGRCPAGGGHSAEGFTFVLSYDIPETGNAQAHWRYCQKCHAMFFNGYPVAGVCAAGGPHQAQGFKFVLQHDAKFPNTTQGSWRYCEKCHVLFYNGYPDKGRCAAGEGHKAQGFNFVLRYMANLDEEVDAHD